MSIYNLDYTLPITVNFASAGVTLGTTSTVTTANNSNCAINGKFATVYNSASNAATPTTDATTGLAFNALQPNQCCVVVFGQNTAGVLKMCQGPIVATLVGVTTTVGSFYDAPQAPNFPDDFCAFAYVIIRTAPSAAAWTPGTSSWTASGVTATTPTNVVQMPARPQIV